MKWLFFLETLIFAACELCYYCCVLFSNAHKTDTTTINWVLIGKWKKIQIDSHPSCRWQQKSDNVFAFWWNLYSCYSSSCHWIVPPLTFSSFRIKWNYKQFFSCSFNIQLHSSLWHLSQIIMNLNIILLLHNFSFYSQITFFCVVYLFSIGLRTSRTLSQSDKRIGEESFEHWNFSLLRVLWRLSRRCCVNCECLVDSQLSSSLWKDVPNSSSSHEDKSTRATRVWKDVINHFTYSSHRKWKEEEEKLTSDCAIFLISPSVVCSRVPSCLRLRRSILCENKNQFPSNLNRHCSDLNSLEWVEVK